jgi:carboxyl-terminal processing protease
MKKNKFALLFALLAIASLTWSFKEDLFMVSKNLDIFATLYKEISINYVEETDPSELMKSGIDAMLETLDPYTVYVPESEVEDFKLKYVSTQFGGIGVSTVFIEGKLFVNEVSEGYPAFKQGMQAGDQIVKINTVEVKGKDRNEVSQLLRGPRGSTLDLVILREGILLSKNLIRDEIRQPNVSYSGMVGELAYIRLDKFLENSAAEVRNAALELSKQQPKGMILDLRYNGGGILQEAVKIVNLFVNKDIVIVTQKGRNAEKTIHYRTSTDPLLPGLPLTVLINGSSASASEIVAGALQDLDRAVIIGQRSYGKGLVQQTFNLPYNSLVKVTVAKYFTPSGRCIQAIDYARGENGKKGRVADSSMAKFNTRTGRNVYDGNGIYPDVVVTPRKLSPVTVSLISKSMFFDYANTYKRSHSTIAAAADFKVTDEEYTAFINTLESRDYAYVSTAERLLNELDSEAVKEQKLAIVKTDLANLKLKMLVSKQMELVTHKAEIKKILESQIVSRYYFEKGRIVQAFQYDKELESAQTVLGSSSKMLAILKGEGAYKTIGDPAKVIAGADSN